MAASRVRLLAVCWFGVIADHSIPVACPFASLVNRMSWAANLTGDYEPEPPNGVALTGGTAFEVAIAVGSSIVVVTSVANVIPPATE